MRPPSASDLLAAWERGLTQRPFEQALALLAAACPEETPAELAELSVGQRDARLLRLRAWVFGERLSSVSRCPQCAETLEFEFAVSDILVESEPPSSLSIEVDGYAAEFRLPNSADLAALAESSGEMSARLLERCILSLTQTGVEPVEPPHPYPLPEFREGEHTPTIFSPPLNSGKVARSAGGGRGYTQTVSSIPISALPAQVAAAIADCMGQADPQTDVQLDLTCPACGHDWRAPFDIVSYLWSEINAWAGRLLGEVHTLAFTYGWDEADILAMSSARRRRYLEMIQA
jgi:hypothetical protein